jgi:beta-lactamase regulating signal transducer with metallopeptidase domain
MQQALQQFVLQFSAVLLQSILYFATAYLFFYIVKYIVAKQLSASYYFVILLSIFSIGIIHFIYNLLHININNTAFVKFSIFYTAPSWLLVPMLSAICCLYGILFIANTVMLIKARLNNSSGHTFPLQLPIDAQLYFQLFCNHHNINYPSIIVCSQSLVPYTKGLLKKVIVIPLAIANNFTYQEMELIVLHELAHIKRGDHYFNIILQSSKILFSANPFANLLLQQAVLEREIACDNWVLQQQVTPYNYASVLYKVASIQQQPHQLQLQFAAAHHSLTYRIKHLFKEHHQVKFKFPFKLFVATSIIIFVINLAQVPTFNKLKNSYAATQVATINLGTKPLQQIASKSATNNLTVIDIKKQVLTADTNKQLIEKAYNDNVTFANPDVVLVSTKTLEQAKPLSVAIQSNFIRVQNTILNVYDTVQLMQQQVTASSVQNLTAITLQQLMQNAITQNEYNSNFYSKVQTLPLTVSQNGMQNIYYKANLQYQLQFDASLQQWLIHFEITNEDKILAKQNVRFVVQRKLQEVNL